MQFKFLGQVYRHTLIIWLLGNLVLCKDNITYCYQRHYFFSTGNLLSTLFMMKHILQGVRITICKNIRIFALHFFGKDFLLQLYSLCCLFIWIICHIIHSGLVIEPHNRKELKGKLRHLQLMTIWIKQRNQVPYLTTISAKQRSVCPDSTLF